jgi:hypothetical protein
MAGPAQATSFEVVVVPGLTLDDLEAVQGEGAVGLINPGAGPKTSAALARASLVRGEVRNSLRGGPPEGEPIIRTRQLGDRERPFLAPGIYLGLPVGGLQANDARYPILVVGGGYEGLLTSDSTRIPGLVSIADVAPTALGRDDALGHEPAANAVGELRDLDDRIDANNDVRLPATLLVCALVLSLAVLRPGAAVPGLAAALAANLLLGIAGVSEFWTVLAVMAAAVVGGGLLLARLGATFALGLVLVGVVAAYLLVLGLDGTAVALSPFGPTQNSRYYGLSNLLETLLLVPALAGAALVWARLGWAGFAASAFVAFAAVAGNRFGADGGGAIVLAAGFAVLAVLLAGAGRRAMVAAVAGALVLALGLIALDAATGGSSHVTRALGDGPGGLARDLADRVELSWERATSSWVTGLVTAALLFVFAFLVARMLGRPEPLAERAVPLSLAAAVVLSLVVNDSPVDVLLVGTTGYVAAAADMIPARWPGSSRSSSRSPRWPSQPAAVEERAPPRRPRP